MNKEACPELLPVPFGAGTSPLLPTVRELAISVAKRIHRLASSAVRATGYGITEDRSTVEVHVCLLGWLPIWHDLSSLRIACVASALNYRAGTTGFEPAISCVTGRRVRPLRYAPVHFRCMNVHAFGSGRSGLPGTATFMHTSHVNF